MCIEVTLCLLPITLLPLLRNLFTISKQEPEEAPAANTVFHFHILSVLLLAFCKCKYMHYLQNASNFI